MLPELIEFNERCSIPLRQLLSLLLFLLLDFSLLRIAESRILLRLCLFGGLLLCFGCRFAGLCRGFLLCALRFVLGFFFLVRKPLLFAVLSQLCLSGFLRIFFSLLLSSAKPARSRASPRTLGLRPISSRTAAVFSFGR